MIQPNTIINNDCLEVMKGIPDKSVDLIVTDPPYNIGKDSWDKIDNYIEWLLVRFKECERVLKENGSFYFFHNDIQVMGEIDKRLQDDTGFIFKQMIVWNKRFYLSKKKGFFDGYVEVEDLRNYKQMAEYIYYYTFQDDTGLTKIMGNCVYPIRDYIRNEILKAKGKIVLKEINQLLGTATNGGGVASATLSIYKTVPAMITEEHYLKLREWLNNEKEYKYLKKEYEDLRLEYEDLRLEYESMRYTFNNQGTHHSIWEYDIAPKIGHLTPKPIPLIKNILLHSSNPNDLILDPFMGSGTTCVAAKMLGRKYIGIELEQKYCDIAQQRLDAVNLDLFINIQD